MVTEIFQMFSRTDPNPNDIIRRAKRCLEIHSLERRGVNDIRGLDDLHRYLRGKQRHPSVPQGARPEITHLAAMSRVNITDLVVSSVAQSLYVDGYRTEDTVDAKRLWEVWQRNRMDARQTAIHRAALAYGVSYVTVLPGDPTPVIRGYSPRRFVALYEGDQADWPIEAMSIEPSGSHFLLNYFDAHHRWTLEAKDLSGAQMVVLEKAEHGGPGFPPVARFVNVGDLDEDYPGEIEPLIPLQDQIDELTFALMIASRYGAFRQRWVIGWAAEDESAALKAAASRVWQFEDADVKVGDFEQTQLGGYIDSRDASLRQAAALSQTPAHELTGTLINLSAEALVAADASRNRKIYEREQSFGESWEQVLALAGAYMGIRIDPLAEVRWRDTESRTLAATVDALGKAATMLGVPYEALWERIPGVTDAELRKWRELRDNDPLLGLREELRRQRGTVDPDGDDDEGDDVEAVA